jgi:hypothetical protein
MFAASAIENFEESTIGNTRGLEDAWLLVLASHAHHSPSQALHSSQNDWLLLLA